MKANNFDRLCWILLIVMAFFLFVACKTTQKANPCNDCPSFSIITIPYTDTIIFNEIHDHLHLDGQYHCLYIESFTTIEIDTIYLEIYETK